MYSRKSKLFCFSTSTGDIKLPARVQEAMQMQVEAERRKRAAILESEGVREAEVKYKHIYMCSLYIFENR